MSFISYTIAWLIIVVVGTMIFNGLDKIVYFLREKTFLGKYYRQQREKHYRMIASYVAEELSNIWLTDGKEEILEKEDKEDKEGDQ